MRLINLIFLALQWVLVLGMLLDFEIAIISCTYILSCLRV
jgi:hypothetical protein